MENKKSGKNVEIVERERERALFSEISFLNSIEKVNRMEI